MSGSAPKFISGPRIAIKVGNATIAYAIGLNLSVSVSVVPVNTMGRFDASSLEPTAYGLVRGSMTVVKLKSATSSGVIDTTTGASGILPDAGTLSQGTGLASHLNPYTVLLSETFDLHVMVANATRDSGKNKYSQFERLTVKECRLSSMNGAVVVAQMLNETVSFEGLLIIDPVSKDEKPDVPAGISAG